MRGIAAVLFESVQENPAIAAGVCTFAVAFALVAGNALYGQKSSHPVPLFATRDAMTTRSVQKADGGDVRKRVRTGSDIARIPVPQIRPQIVLQAKNSSNLVRDTQESLRARGLYDGEVDGLYGPKTRDAILSYQRDEGIEATGEVSLTLVKLLRENARPQARPARTAAAEADAPLKPVKVAVTVDSAQASPAVRETVKAVAASFDETTMRQIKDAATIARIQIGLINFGESGITVDGMMNEETAEAIRRFQGRYGLDIDGMPGDDLLIKMEEIGALKKS